MQIENVQKSKIRKNISMIIRTTKPIRMWLMENSISPQKVFDEAIKELISINYKNKVDKKI